MARLARADLVDPLEVAAYHCIHRCVRRSFLCGNDPYNGRKLADTDASRASRPQGESRGASDGPLLGRPIQVREAMSAELAPILVRLGIADRNWLTAVTSFGRHFQRVAGAPRTVGKQHPRSQPSRTFRPGRAELLGCA